MPARWNARFIQGRYYNGLAAADLAIVSSGHRTGGETAFCSVNRWMSFTGLSAEAQLSKNLW